MTAIWQISLLLIVGDAAKLNTSGFQVSPPVHILQCLMIPQALGWGPSTRNGLRTLLTKVSAAGTQNITHHCNKQGLPAKHELESQTDLLIYLPIFINVKQQRTSRWAKLPITMRAQWLWNWPHGRRVGRLWATNEIHFQYEVFGRRNA